MPRVKKGEVAAIDLNGQIVPNNRIGSQNKIMPYQVEKLTERALKKGVKGVIYEIDSPGGAVVPSAEIADYVKGLKVPTAAVVHGSATSGAYLIASACGIIIANRFSRIGSIGVLSVVPDASELAEKLGIKLQVIKSGVYKGAGMPTIPLTDDEIKLLQNQSDQIYEGFIEDVAKNRSIDVTTLRPNATGWAWVANEAQTYGLVDVIGGINDAKKYIEQQGGFDQLNVKRFAPTESFLEGILRPFGGNSNALGNEFGVGVVEGITDALSKINET